MPSMGDLSSFEFAIDTADLLPGIHMVLTARPPTFRKSTTEQLVASRCLRKKDEASIKFSHDH